MIDDALLNNLAISLQENKLDSVYEMILLLFINVEYFEENKKIDDKLLPKIQEIVMEINLNCKIEEIYFMSLKCLQILNKTISNSSPIKLFDRLFDFYR